jgi:hypothetical protein
VHRFIPRDLNIWADHAFGRNQIAIRADFLLFLPTEIPNAGTEECSGVSYRTRSEVVSVGGGAGWRARVCKLDQSVPWAVRT